MNDQKPNPAWQHSVTISITLLAFAAGTSDVMSYLQLGHVFTSAATGSTALLGLALSQGKWTAAIHAASALGGFVTGCLIAASVHGRRSQDMVRATDLRHLFALEVAALAIFVVAWQFLPHPLPHGAVYGLLAVSGAAMGIQNVAARQIEVPGVNTVVLNNTITSIMVSLARPSKKVEHSSGNSESLMRQSWVFASYIAGALLAGLVAADVKRATGALPFLALLIVLFVFSRLRHSPAAVNTE